MPEQTFDCPACGGPNQPEAGASRMACTYCGANLPIPERLRTQAEPPAQPRVTPRAIPKPEAKVRERPGQNKNRDAEARAALRMARPLIARALNIQWLFSLRRWFIPACLTVVLVALILCVALGMLPVMLNLIWQASAS